MMETDQITHSDLELRERMLVAARDLFYIHGFSRVTMEEIANKLGMSKKTIYKFFESKDEIVQDVVRKTLTEVDTACKELMLQSNVNFVDKLKQMMTTVGMQYSRMGRPLIEDLQRNSPAAWKMISDYRTEKIQRDFGTLLKEGIDKGVFRNDIDRELVLLIYTHSIQDIINPEILSRIPFTAAQVFDAIIKVIFEGILTEVGRKQYHPDLSI